jgi:hypothetical protein
MDFYRFCQILTENMRDYRPEDDIEYPRVSAQEEFAAQLILKGGVLHDLKRNRTIDAITPQVFQGILGAPNDTYTLEATVYVSGDYAPGYDQGGDDAIRGRLDVDVENALVINDRTREEAYIPDEIARRLFGEGPNFPYQIEYDDRVSDGKIDFRVV